MLNPGNHKLLERYGVLSAIELESRYEICSEEYLRKIQIEGVVSRDMARNIILPVVEESYGELVQTFKAATEAEVSAGVKTLKVRVETLGQLLDQLYAKIEAFDAFNVINVSNCQDYICLTQELRTTVDSLERLIDDRKWPLPKYREMLFIL